MESLKISCYSDDAYVDLALPVSVSSMLTVDNQVGPQLSETAKADTSVHTRSINLNSYIFELRSSVCSIS
jgi:hypothetical protein